MFANTKLDIKKIKIFENLRFLQNLIKYAPIPNPTNVNVIIILKISALEFIGLVTDNCLIRKT